MKHFSDTATIKGYGSALAGLGGIMFALQIKTMGAATAFKAFKVAMIKSGVGFAVVAVGELASRFIFVEDAVEGASESFENVNKQLATTLALTNMFPTTGDPDNFTLMPPPPTEEELARMKRVDDLIKMLAEGNDKVSKSAKVARASLKAVTDEISRMIIKGEDLSKIKLGDIIGQMLLSSAITGGLGVLLGGTGLGTFLGLVNPFAKAHTGGLIKNDGNIQRFATGGSVRGGDNVPILAQGGEFVRQRSAVESIGIENLNRMNQGGSSSVNVSVSGNVMTQDFVEGELADSIKNAIRRGSDFGIG